MTIRFVITKYNPIIPAAIQRPNIIYRTSQKGYAHQMTVRRIAIKAHNNVKTARLEINLHPRIKFDVTFSTPFL